MKPYFGMTNTLLAYYITQYSRFVRHEIFPGLVCVAPPLPVQMRRDGVRGVQGHVVARVMPETAEHCFVIRHHFLKTKLFNNNKATSDEKGKHKLTILSMDA